MTDDRNPKQQKNAALELAIAGVEKEYGNGAIMRLKDGQSLHDDVAAVPSGSLGLDIALGIGGYPRGRIVEIYGPESSGKTTLTLHAIASIHILQDAGRCQTGRKAEGYDRGPLGRADLHHEAPIRSQVVRRAGSDGTIGIKPVPARRQRHTRLPVQHLG